MQIQIQKYTNTNMNRNTNTNAAHQPWCHDALISYIMKKPPAKHCQYHNKCLGPLKTSVGIFQNIWKQICIDIMINQIFGVEEKETFRHIDPIGFQDVYIVNIIAWATQYTSGCPKCPILAAQSTQYKKINTLVFVVLKKYCWNTLHGKLHVWDEKDRGGFK